MRRRLSLITAVLLLLSGFGAADVPVSYTSELDNISASVRESGMGDVSQPIGQEAVSPLTNPASGGLSQKIEADISYSQLFGLAQYMPTSLMLPFGKLVSGGVVYVRHEDGDIHYKGPLQGNSLTERMENPALRSEGTTGSDTVFTNLQEKWLIWLAKGFSGPLAMGGLSVMPITVNFSVGSGFRIYHQVEKDLGLNDVGAINTDVDIGSRMQFILDIGEKNKPLRILDFGASVLNLFETGKQWNPEYREQTYRDIRAGVGFTQYSEWLRGYLLLAYDYSRYESVHNVGLEYNFRDRLWLRSGLHRAGFGKHSVPQGEFTAGASVKIWLVTVDYAFFMQELANTPYFIGLRFEKPIGFD